ncbi:sialate O-acetylesterase [Maribacter algicola]|uniref:Sialate O-acetylesterase n=1 Tax=Meishania litoralis TaxID=3434685 RepID=A0ACC7LP89_9FLAO
MLRIYTLKGFLFMILVSALFACEHSQKEEDKIDLSLNSLFSDHMVLQQNDDVAFWGKYTPAQELSIVASWGEKTSVSTDGMGQWTARLKTPRAGGPFTVTITAKDSTITLKDILIGEVWLASGQSNMEMPLKGFLPNDPIDDSEEEIANANFPQIRYIDVPRTIAPLPEKEFEGQWKPLNPETASDFSATAYFFARKLHQELDVPVGIITSNWGGTPVESWMSKEKIISLGEFEKELEAIKPENIKVFEDWYSKFPTKKIPVSEEEWQNLNLDDAAYANSDFDDSKWNTTALPVVVENLKVINKDGVYWFRKKVMIEDQTSNYTFKVTGGIDDSDITYVNGEKIGSTFGHNTPRNYAIRKGLLKEGENTLAVRVIDTGGGGGFIGDVTLTKNDTDTAVDILEGWSYQQIAGIQVSDFLLLHKNQGALENPPKGLESFKLDAHTPSTLYNGMIKPLIPYSVKGAIWYQGESNVGRHDQYLKLFPGMIQDWRERWNGDFSFYFVQIAPFEYGNGLSPALRDAQRKSLKTPKTGMAVTMDIGVSNNIHPGNKQDVGDRLARLALVNDYGKDIVASGPLYKSQTISGNKIALAFEYAESGLVAQNPNPSGFEIAGEDRIFHPAVAKIEGDKVEVSSPSVNAPKYVRYGWKDYIAGSLFNTEGLPASSFTTEE